MNANVDCEDNLEAAIIGQHGINHTSEGFPNLAETFQMFVRWYRPTPEDSS
jgi:hypothetical protein